MLNHLLELLPLQVTVIVSIVVRKHDADQVLLAVIILGHQSGVVVQEQIVLRQALTISSLCFVASDLIICCLDYGGPLCFVKSITEKILF